MTSQQLERMCYEVIHSNQLRAEDKLSIIEAYINLYRNINNIPSGKC